MIRYRILRPDPTGVESYQINGGYSAGALLAGALFPADVLCAWGCNDCSPGSTGFLLME